MADAMASAQELSIDSTVAQLSTATLSMTVQLAGLAMLPVELLTQICLLLPRPDLRTVRHVSRTLQLAADALLFSTVYLKLNLTSFKRLQDIADHPRFSTLVRYIDYDGRQLYHEGPDPNYREWRHLYAGNGLPFASNDPEEEFVALFSNRQLMEFYNRYCLYLTGQKYILRAENEKMMLVAALRKLKGLKGVKYYLKEDDESYEDSSTPFSALSPIARDILVMPSKSYTEKSNNHIWNLMDAVAKSGLGNVQELEGTDLSLSMWKMAAGNHKECYYMMGGLEKLKMEFVFERSWPGDARPLAQILTHSTNLRELRISFDTMIFAKVFTGELRGVHLTDFIPNSRKFDSLVHLSLKAVVATEEELKSFLLRHVRTLKSFWLSNMLLERDMNISDPKRRHGSWIRIIEFLHHKMNLNTVSIQGILYNGVDQSWYIVEDGHEHAREERDCLKNKVERYVTRNGPYPFKTKEKTNYLLKIEDDASWRAEEYMLRQAPDLFDNTETF